MKLLTYSSRKHLWLSSLLIILSIPIFYLLVNFFFLESIDQKLRAQAASLSSYTHEIKTPADLELWKRLNQDFEISLYDQDSFKSEPFTVEILNPADHDFEGFRYLQKRINIFGINHTITFKVSLAEKDELIQNILLAQISLLFLIFIGFLLINRVVGKKMWKPFHRIVQFLKSYELLKSGNGLDEKLDINEFNDLKNEIQSLIHRTETAYQLQKEFTENAAHELQTPVAIIKSKLDLLLQEKDLSRNQSVLIDQIYYVLQKLSDLNKNLLFLSKIENQQFDFEDEIDCEKTVFGVIENLNFFAEAKYQQLLLPRPEEKYFKGNQALFDQLVQNLMINAIQYSPKGSVINAILTEDELRIVNEGKPLAFSEEKLFSRFSKTIEKEQKGNGLGLAICKKIAHAHGFAISYEYSGGKHHFIVHFNQPNQAEQTT